MVLTCLWITLNYYINISVKYLSMLFLNLNEWWANSEHFWNVTFECFETSTFVEMSDERSAKMNSVIFLRA